MKSCTYCGRENRQDATSCLECGTTEFTSGPAEPTSPVPASQVVTAEDPIPPGAQAALPPRGFPIFAWLACAVCIVIFLGLNSEKHIQSWEAFARWGCYPPERIYSGAYWGFITSAFVHEELWHVAFNVYWLYLLGTKLELGIGHAKFVAFILAAAFVSSGAEFAISGTTGIGASGFVYAIFGLMWLTRGRFSAYAGTPDRRTIVLFLVWLVACVVMTLIGIMNVANAAHIAGLLFGMGIGVCVIYPRWRRVTVGGLALMFLLVVVSPLWAPWSGGWNQFRAIRAHKKGDYPTALKYYERGMARGQDKVWSLQNMALCFYSLGDTNGYQELLQTLRRENFEAARSVGTEILKQATNAGAASRSP